MTPSRGVMRPISPYGSPLRSGSVQPSSTARVGSAPWAAESTYRNSSRAGGRCRDTVAIPNGANGTMYELNSPIQSIRRSPPVLPIRTSRPAPPYTRSSNIGWVSGMSPTASFTSGVDGSSPSRSSAWSRSLPQPPHRVSWPVPPTTQSLPRSPKRTSSPSVRWKPVETQVPFGAVSVQPSRSGPSSHSLLRNHANGKSLIGALSVQVWPLGE